MAVRLLDIDKYEPLSSDIFLFDNSIWMYLFCPLGNYNLKKQKQYSRFLKSIDSSRSSIFVSSLILSEFANRYLRLDYDLWIKEPENYNAKFKNDFIGNERYRETVNEIRTSIKNILSLCEKTSDNFNAIDLNHVLNHFEYIDFNDSYYIEMAKLGKLKLVTDDSDFVKYQGHNLEVVTTT